MDLRTTLRDCPELAGRPLAEATLGYLHNLVCDTPLAERVGSALDHMLPRFLDVLVGRCWESDAVRSGVPLPPPDERCEPPNVRRALQLYRRQAPPTAPVAPGPVPLGRNLALVARLLALGDTEQSLLQFFIVLKRSAELRAIIDLLGEVSTPDFVDLVSAVTCVSAAAARRAFGRQGNLVRMGLLTVSLDCEDPSSKVALDTQLLDLLFLPRLDRRRVFERYVPSARPPSLEWEDFGTVHGQAELVRDLLRAALAHRQKGVNVLLHGATGTGKSELCRLLARELGVPLYAVGVTDNEGASPMWSERLTSLKLANQLAGKDRALLLFDEIEDLFDWRYFASAGGRANNSMSKIWFNEILETNPCPTFWVTNRLDGIDEAYLRRFSSSLELKPAGARQRERVLRRHLGEQRWKDEEVRAVAERYEVAPGQIASAVSSARLLEHEPARATVEKLLAPMQKLLTRCDPTLVRRFQPESYRLDAVACRQPLAPLVDRLAEWKPGEGGLSLCLYGPPGTGKSELVKYLAWRMGRRVVHKRVSDILSKWVGEAEKNIAQAFDEAREDDAVLLFDEADSFLRDRREAVRSWEVSLVNEFLQQLEAFEGVVACTTNLWHEIDQAALRRFVFKLELGYLSGGQSRLLFRELFGQQAPNELDRLSTLTPGDFAAVRRRVRALGGAPPPAELLRELAAEVKAKGVPARAVGF